MGSLIGVGVFLGAGVLGCFEELYIATAAEFKEEERRLLDISLNEAE